MFWARSAALAPLFKLQFHWDDYPEEPLPGDGTLLHALERILPFVASHNGYRYAVTNVPELPGISSVQRVLQFFWKCLVPACSLRLHAATGALGAPKRLEIFRHFEERVFYPQL